MHVFSRCVFNRRTYCDVLVLYAHIRIECKMCRRDDDQLRPAIHAAKESKVSLLRIAFHIVNDRVSGARRYAHVPTETPCMTVSTHQLLFCCSPSKAIRLSARCSTSRRRFCKITPFSLPCTQPKHLLLATTAVSDCFTIIGDQKRQSRGLLPVRRHFMKSRRSHV